MSLVNHSLTNSGHVLDPELIPIFSEQVYAAALKAPKSPRELFYSLNHVNEHFSELADVYIFLNNHLSEIKREYQNKYSEDFDPDRRYFEINQPFINPVDYQLTPTDLKACLKQIAPIGLTELSWLQSISQAATSYEPLAVDLMAVYLKLQQGKPFKTLLQAQLLEAGLDLPALHTQQYAQQPGIMEKMFEFATLQLAFAQFPRVFFPEILGFTFAYCEITPLLQFFAGQQQNLAVYFWVRQTLLDSVLTAVKGAIRDYLSLFTKARGYLWQRVQTGYWLYRHQTWHAQYELKKHLDRPALPSQDLIELIRQKAPLAFGHHGKIQLTGKSLDDWFKQEPFAGEDFLIALQQSIYIDRQNPLQSRLLKLFEYKNPMFGVLNDREMQILLTWLNTSPTLESLHEIVKESQNIDELHPTQPVGISTKELVTPALKLANPGLFHALLNVELYPDVLPAAKQKVQQVLRGSYWLNRIPFKSYAHDRFEAFIHGLYQKEQRAYRPLEGKPKLSRQTYIWGIEQLAPTILSDGCWLQDVWQLHEASIKPIGEILGKIFSDELGAGILKQNHPYIYQQLLEELAIPLPPLHSKAFIEHPGFLKSAFDIPVYLLAISKFPNVFLPELLGLNMAIELSGLGNGYLRLAEALKFWGINPAIVNVHISIDNLASGHAALAKTAIELYMDYLAANHGTQTMHEHWGRVYNGYCSLATASLRFKIVLATQYFLHQRT